MEITKKRKRLEYSDAKKMNADKLTSDILQVNKVQKT